MLRGESLDPGLEIAGQIVVLQLLGSALGPIGFKLTAQPMIGVKVHVTIERKLVRRSLKY